MVGDPGTLVGNDALDMELPGLVDLEVEVGLAAVAENEASICLQYIVTASVNTLQDLLSQEEHQSSSTPTCWVLTFALRRSLDALWHLVDDRVLMLAMAVKVCY